MSSSNTRQSTVTATFRGVGDSLEFGLMHKETSTRLSQDRIDRLNGIGFDWTPPRGGSRKRKAPPSTRKMSLSRKERVSSPGTNVNSPSVGDGARGAEPGEERYATSSKVPSQRSDHNRGTESDDEVDEIVQDSRKKDRKTSDASTLEDYFKQAIRDAQRTSKRMSL